MNAPLRSLILGALALLLGISGSARAETRTYAIVIGNNAPLPGGAADQQPLRYADDDAAGFYRLAREMGWATTLLTVLDHASQQRFPEAAAVAQPPTLAELRRVLLLLRPQFVEDQKTGREAVLMFFYSGHGGHAAGQPPSLALLDGGLTQAILYDEVLAALPARYVHLLVDACYAETVVRPRDSNAEVVTFSEKEVGGYLERATLARFPHVGALIATDGTTQSHEWDVYQQGVFSHELLSGLRGAADANADGRIEYSELHAFMSAANREVRDPRAHSSIVSHPPLLNRRAPLLDQKAALAPVWLIGAPGPLGGFFVEDTRGNRLVDLYAEAGFAFSLLLPAGVRLYVRSYLGESALQAEAGGRIFWERLKFHPPSTAPRGALAEAMQRGLFAIPFGPAYYRGFVDHHDDLIAVPLADAPELVRSLPAPPRARRTAAWLLLTATGALLVTASVFTGLAASAYADYQRTDLERPAAEARERFTNGQAAAIATALGAGVTAGIGGFLLGRSARRNQPRAQAALSAGSLGFSW